MDPMLVQYALFILAALFIIAAAVSLNRWLYRHNKPNADRPNTWAKLDIKRSETREEMPISTVFDDGDEEEAELHVRAKQNGHHVNGHKPLI